MQASSLRASFSQISPAYVSLGLITALSSMFVRDVISTNGMKAAIDNVRLAPECNNMLMGPENVAESGRPDIGTFFPNLAPHIKMSCLPCRCIAQRASPSQTLRRSFETAPCRRQNVPNSGRSSGRGSTTITACNPVKGSSARQRQITHRYCTERTGTSARSVGSNAMCPSLTSCCRACRCPHVGRHCCTPLTKIVISYQSVPQGVIS